MAAYKSNRFEGTHLDGNHIGVTEAKRLAGLIGGTTPPTFGTDSYDGGMQGVALASLEVATPGAEAADIVEVSAQLVDANGDPLPEARGVVISLFDVNGVEMLVAAATVSVTTGSPVTNDAQPRVFAVTDATGAIVFDVEDATAALVGSIFGTIEPVDGRSLGKTFFACDFA